MRSSISALFIRINDNVSVLRRGMRWFSGKWFSLPILVLSAFGCAMLVSVLCGYHLFGLNINKYVIQFYLCDYSVGFCTRLFVGAVITHFTDTVSTELMDRIINISVALTLIIQALFAGISLRLAMKKGSLLCCFLSVSFVCIPLCVTENMVMPGLLDAYILLLFYVWCVLYRTPIVSFVAPPICFICMAIHYGFCFSFLPPILVLLLYKTVFGEKKRMRVASGVSLGVSATVSAASCYWFLFLAKDHLHMTSDEFYEHMLRRLDMNPVMRRANLTALHGVPIYKDYFDFYIFGEYKGDNYYEQSGDYVSFMKDFANAFSDKEKLNECLLQFLPFFLIFLAIWISCIVKSKGMKRFVFFCCAAQSVALLFALFVSTDYWRWISAALISQFMVFLTVFNDKNQVLFEVLHIFADDGPGTEDTVKLPFPLLHS